MRKRAIIVLAIVLVIILVWWFWARRPAGNAPSAGLEAGVPPYAGPQKSASAPPATTTVSRNKLPPPPATTTVINNEVPPPK